MKNRITINKVGVAEEIEIVVPSVSVHSRTSAQPRRKPGFLNKKNQMKIKV